jgi:hypothetical protein
MAALSRAVGDVVAALGPTVAPRDAHRSWRWARIALDLVKRGELPSEAPTRASRHLATMILLGDVEMAATLARERLSALEHLPAADRQRLLQTLDSADRRFELELALRARHALGETIP